MIQGGEVFFVDYFINLFVYNYNDAHIKNGIETERWESELKGELETTCLCLLSAQIESERETKGWESESEFKLKDLYHLPTDFGQLMF